MSSLNVLQFGSHEVSVSSLYQQRLTKLLRRIASIFCLIVIDSICMLVATVVAATLLDHLLIWNELLLPLLPVAIVFLLLVMSRLRLYNRLPHRQRYKLVVLGFSIPWLMSLLASHYYNALVGLDSLLVLGWSIGLPLVVVSRRIYDTFAHNLQRYRWMGMAALFVGDAEAEAEFMGALPDVLADCQIIGCILPTHESEQGGIGTIDDLLVLLQKYPVCCIILATSVITSQLFQSVVQYCDYSGVKLLVLQPPLLQRKCISVFSSPQSDTVPVLEVQEPWWYTAQLLGKRVIDIMLAGLGILLLMPLLLVIALLIRLESEGPVFFQQLRVGCGGKNFVMWKFRTMEVNAEERLKELEQFNESAGGVLFKMKEDPRVTRIGKFLRRTSLDELPQLFNVLQGHMSLVGPRPLQLRDRDLAMKIKANRDFLARRSTRMPGVTGLWQVSGRSEVAFEDMLLLDIYYIEHWSLWLDLHIIWRTIIVVLISKGAY